MSYDLYFLVPQGQAAPTAADDRAHFGSRPGYQEQESQFWYANEDTGVYFPFGLEPPGEEDDEADEDDEAQDDACVVPYGHLAPRQRFGRRVRHEPPYLLLDYEQPPAEVQEFFRRQDPIAGDVDGLRPDEVLTHDVLERASSRAGEPA